MSDAESTLEMARESYAVAYVTAVCATTVLLDYWLTFGDEVRRMWPTSLSIPKVLFFVDRYVVLPMLVINAEPSLSQRTCVFYLRWLVVCITVTNATVEGILLTRVIALYRDNTAIVVFSCLLYAAGISTLIGLTVKDYVGEAVHIVQDFSALPGCYAASVPSIIAGYWITSTVVESMFFILVMYRVVTWSRDNMSVPPALMLMARDSSIYFALIFALLIVNLFVFEYAPPFLSSIFVTPANTAGCIAGARMLMNLRTFAARDAGMNDSELEMSRVSALRFGPVRGAGDATDAGDTNMSMGLATRLAWARGAKSRMQSHGDVSTATGTGSGLGSGSGSGTMSSGMTSATTAASTDVEMLSLPVVSFVLPHRDVDEKEVGSEVV